MRKSLSACLGLWLLIGLAPSVFGQSSLDALRYSNTGVYSTARSMGMAGAFSAVGADFSATTLNPAGLALYRRSDLMFTPTLRIIANDGSYLGSSNSGSKANFGFTNIGYVASAPVNRWNSDSRAREESTSGLKSYSFSIGYNQIANFHRRNSFDAFNGSSSITDFFAGLANGDSYLGVDGQDNTSLAGMAWGAGLIDTSGVDGNWIGAAPGGMVRQQLNQEETGRINDWNIGLAGNFGDKIYAGVSLGIRGLRYSSDFSYAETDINDVHNTYANDSTPINSVTYTDIYGVRGSGFNLNIGVIARPLDFLRVGLAIQTPTWYSMSDEYVTEITSTFDGDPLTYGLQPLSGVYTYNFASPFRVTLGAMGLIGKKGFISADFEYLDYSTGKFSSDVSPSSSFFYAFTGENQDIRQQFTTAYNIRLGGEYRMGPGRFRLGYGYNGAVLNEEYLEYVDYETGNLQNLAGIRQIISGGVGLKQKNYYLDLAYVREYNTERKLMYTVQDVSAYSPEVINRITTNLFSMTIGFTF